jgi:pyruvate/2-oxoglutarate dehydrogenase complex dihydrolipoamide acyltransferase (E2) component
MEVFTDKLVAKIPSTASGLVTAVNYEDDDVAKVGHPLITIDEEEEEGAQAPQEVVADTPVETI